MSHTKSLFPDRKVPNLQHQMLQILSLSPFSNFMVTQKRSYTQTTWLSKPIWKEHLNVKKIKRLEKGGRGGESLGEKNIEALLK